MLAVSGLINASVLPVAVRSTTIDEAGKSNPDRRSRTDRLRNPDRANIWTRTVSTVMGGSVSAAPEPFDSQTQSTTPGANGRIAFTRSLQIIDVQVMNADGSNRINLSNRKGLDGFPVWSPDGSKIAFTSLRDGNQDIYVMNADGSSSIRLTSDPKPDSGPTWSPDATRIAFTSDRDGITEIYLMNADGSNQTRLTGGPWWNSSPAWSPDGARIAFTSGRAEPDGGIYVMNSDGGNQTKLTNSLGMGYQPAWSSDGSRIAFTSYRDGDAGIYVMNADGSNPTRLTNNSQFNGEPAWSPDNRKIAFTSYRDGNDEIYVMNADGSNQTRVTNNPAWDSSPRWSPEGDRIAFTTFECFRPEIYLMNADGSGLLNLTNDPANDYDPAWSPDGARIAFTSERRGKPEIFVMNADGSNQINLTNDRGRDRSPTWSPDGSRIAFIGERYFPGTDLRDAPQLYVMNADGSHQIQLTNYQDGIVRPSWSPDGARIAFGTFLESPNYDYIIPDEIFVTNADGSNQVDLTNNPGLDSEPAWSPDGARIAFTRQPSDNSSGPLTDREIYVMNADGSDQIRLTNDRAQKFDPAWSADGSRIAFTSNRDGGEEIYEMNADGSNQTRLTKTPAAGTARGREPSYEPCCWTPPVPARITSVSVSGKKLFVFGENFDPGAVILLNGEDQKTGNDEQNPKTIVIAKKAGKKIKPGDKLQVRNPNGSLSEEFTFSGRYSTAASTALMF